MDIQATMNAAVFEKEGVLTVKEINVPRVHGAKDVLVKVEAVSICGTDVHITNVPPGYIATPNTVLGHEFVGVVVEVGEAVKAIAVGDRVVVNPNDYCGCCKNCRANLPNFCENIIPLGIDADGAFAEYCMVSENVSYKISKDVPADVAACAEPLACAINGFNKVQIKPGQKAAVIGAGPIGIIMAMLLKQQGITDITVFEVQEYRKAFVEKLGFAKVVDSRGLTPENYENLAFDHVFEMTGSQFPMAVKIAAVGSNIVLFGVNKQATVSLPQFEVTTKEIQVHGTWLANATFPAAVKLLEDGNLPLNDIITDVIPLAQVCDGIEKLAKGQAIKVIVKP